MVRRVFFSVSLSLSLSLSLASLFFKSKFNTPDPPRPPLQAPLWLLPSASRLPQVRTGCCCPERSNATGAVAKSARRKIDRAPLLWLSCSFALLSSKVLALPPLEVDSASSLPSAQPLRRRSAPHSTPHGAARMLASTSTWADASRDRRKREGEDFEWRALIDALCRRFLLSSASHPLSSLSQSCKTSPGARVAIGARRSTAHPRVAPIAAAGAPAYVPDMDKRVRVSFLFLPRRTASPAVLSPEERRSPRAPLLLCSVLSLFPSFSLLRGLIAPCSSQSSPLASHSVERRGRGQHCVARGRRKERH